MFFDVLLLIAAYTTTKSVRDAVFLSKFDLTDLSYLMIAIAVASGFLVSAFTRLTAGVSRNVLTFGSNGFIALTLVLISHGLRAGWPWMSWALYFWSAVFGLVLVAEFWLLANDLFHAREAKRLFPVIGAGAILGGVIGGAVSGWLARPLGAANLLYIVAAELVLASGLAHLAWTRRPAEVRAEGRRANAQPRFAEGFALVRKNRYVRLLAMMMICMTVCMTLVQWQYKGIAKIHFGSRRDEMASFFGILSAVLSLASFVLQVLGTPKLLKRFGVMTGLRILPSGVLVGAAALVAATSFPALALTASVVAVLVSDGFRFSVDKASVELLYLPIPRAVKDQAKPFIDTVVDRFAGALSGFLWLFLTWAFDIDRPSRIGYASIVTVAVVCVWLVVISRARRGYMDAYRQMLSPTAAAVTPAPEAKVRPHPRAGECAEMLRAALLLDAPARTHALRAIGRLVHTEPTLRLPRMAIEPHLRKESSEVALLVRALAAEGVEPLADRHRTRPLLERALEEKLDQALERIARLLALAYPPRDILAAHRALRGGSPQARAGALELLDNLLEGDSKSELLQALDEVALGGARPFTIPRERPRREERVETLRALLEIDDPWLRACAAFTARAAGLLTAELDRLERADHSPVVQEAARIDSSHALAILGEERHPC